MDWLFAPIDPSRAHDVSFAVSWHARSMVLAWGVIAPLAILAARFFKVMPGQDWPRELDNQAWWRSHWMGQSCVVGLSIFAFALVLPSDLSNLGAHAILGYCVLLGTIAQILLGVFRGSKGGPTAPGPDGSIRGHHYDMTRWRRQFELAHKLIGYGTLLAAMAAILLGLWKSNGPIWMWISLSGWWFALIVIFFLLQKRGMAVDTYQAIWGTDPEHPGNQMPAPGWGMRRFGDSDKGESNVRDHRRDRVRSH